MKFAKLPIIGSYLIALEKREDERGFFARAFAAEEMQKHGLVSVFPHTNLSYNKYKGTIRGLHYQAAPFAETKLMRCIQGEIYNVFIDLREDSETYLHWHGVRLSADQDTAVYIPAGCANGYQALTDGAKALYQTSVPYHPEAERGIRWDDKTFAIFWPVAGVLVSEKDKQFADFRKGEK